MHGACTGDGLMRMRKKKNLVPRMAACGDLLVADPAALRGCWRQHFDRSGELFLEIGCGKGQFAVGTAARCPDDLFIAVEKSANVLLLAMEKTRDAGLENLRFIGTDAAMLADAFAPAEVSRIYLNFSDPWPPNNRAKRRLTHPNFLRVYDNILRPGGEIRMKTDNRALFEFSLCQLTQFGYPLLDVSIDLHSRQDIDNVMTEYEQRFSSQGMPIYYLCAQKPEPTAAL